MALKRKIFLEKNVFEKSVKHFNAACEYHKENNYDSALEELRKALENGFDAYRVHLDMARIYMKKSLYDVALKELDMASEVDLKSGEINAEKSRIYERMKKYDNALNEMIKAVEKGFESADVYGDLGRILSEKGEYDKALLSLKKAVSIDPDNFKYHTMLGRVYEQKEVFNSALEEFQQALELNPDHENCYADLGRLYEKTGESEKAVEYFNESVKKGCNRYEIYESLAGFYFNNGEYDKAAEEIKKAIILAPEEWILYEKKAKIHEKKKEYDEAISGFNKAAEYNPNKENMYRNISRIYFLQGKLELSLKELKKALKVNPECGDINAESARIYERQRRSDLAIAEMEEALRKGYEDYIFRLRLGEFYRKEGKDDLARSEFSKAARVSPYRDEIWFKNKILNQTEILDKKTILDSKPAILDIHLTNRCNLDCIMCPRKSDSQWDIPENIVKEVIDNFPYLENISWLGGEVFLSEYFSDIIEKASDYPNLRQEVVTNGLLIDEYWAKKLTSVNIDICYSIDSFKKDSYEHIRRGAKFKDLLRSIELINKYKNNNVTSGITVNTGVCFVVMKTNFRELAEAVKFLKEYGFDSFKIMKILGDYPENIFINKDNEALSFIRSVVSKIKQEAEEENIGFACLLDTDTDDYCNNSATEKTLAVNEKQMETCLFPWKSMMVEMSGNVTPWCYCGKVIGNVGKSSLQELWNNEIMQDYREKMLNGSYCEYCDHECVARKTDEFYCT